ncbi:carbon-nitrogen hydrolase family protein [Pigmentiphaga aceris]|uniref:Carbon-nitrogen hydrolase family protein n=1 Tax=Pigmentiphaga aceris TaxID=1940612 RepID=A0A5C0B282_9BURK|nr:carbon-nitrogen hydrolase family protein [Pigmentiphaga aceris]QEI06707.1 carbon-nitrogen hydrolase family protein [Pigmentiphaga aceris]
MPLIVAAAQTISVAGDVPANIVNHLRVMQAAANHCVQLLVFPELSLTGYEPTLAHDLAILADDPRLAPMRELAQKTGMRTVIGAPLKMSVEKGAGIGIAALVLQLDGTVSVYTKQHLHPGEEKAFVPGFGGTPVLVDDAKIALAVCADATHASHADHAAQIQPAVYAVGSVITTGSYPAESAQLAGYAAQHNMAVLLANHGGPTGGWSCAGCSAVWAPGGEQVAVAPGLGEFLVIATRNDGIWSGEAIAL